MDQANNMIGDLLGSRAQVSVSDQLYQQISKLILSNKLPEGYVFPNETVLCEQLNVGRTSLREAYKALELTGYVIRTKKGTFVNSKNNIIAATPLKTVFIAAKPDDFKEFRLMLEQETSCQAASKASLEDIKVLNQLIEVSEKAKQDKDYAKLIETDLQFHQKIAEIADNELLTVIVNVMYDSWKNHVEENFFSLQNQNSPIFETMLIQHREIVDAIYNRDPQKAKAAMREHVESVSSIITKE